MMSKALISSTIASYISGEVSDMTEVEEKVEAEEIEEKEERSWFERWLDYVARTEQRVEPESACFYFPYSCY